VKSFVDTNVLLYANDVADPGKRAVAVALIDRLLREESGCLSFQVLQEFYANATGKMRIARELATTRAHLYARLGVVPMTEDLLFSAVDLHRFEPISFWDALIVRSAQAARCDVLYSEDLQPGRSYGTMRIVNPFAAV
jgi:predicted nucleic acid-binding protein